MSVGRTLARVVLGGFLLLAGVAHLSVAREEFRAQVPEWVPVAEDTVVVVSGVVEIVLGGALLVAPASALPAVGLTVAAFFVAIFPGNVAQWREGVDAFGLDSDTARFTRLLFQPVLIAVALWCTGAGARLRELVRRGPPTDRGP